MNNKYILKILLCGRDDFGFGFFVDVLVVLGRRYLTFSCILSDQKKKKKTMEGEKILRFTMLKNWSYFYLVSEINYDILYS